ncbi:MAG: hypothetical protein SOR89_01095 [Ndongobacter sp.]|nr:hypothetical protein [Ndongobacter sp.]
MERNLFILSQLDTTCFQQKALAEKQISDIERAYASLCEESFPFGVRLGELRRCGEHLIELTLWPQNGALRTRIFVCYFLRRWITQINELGLGLHVEELSGSDAPTQNSFFRCWIGVPEKPYYLKDIQFSSALSLEQYVFFQNFSQPANKEQLNALGYFELFYQIKFLPSRKGTSPWRFVLGRDTVECYLFEEAAEDVAFDAGNVMSALEALFQSQGYAVEWRVEPKKRERGYYIGMAMISD